MALASVGVVARRAVLLSAAATLLILAAESAATPRQSAPDQYEQQPSPPPRSIHPKLNRVHLAHTGYHRFSLLPTTNHKDVKVPELQVGCAEGSLHEHDHGHDPSINLLKNSMKFRHKRQASSTRIVWLNIEQQDTSSPTVLQAYQPRTTIPFYVPVWGNPRHIPIFFPTKPILFNPGYQSRNRPMPGVVQPSPNVTIDSRIRDDKPSWGIVEPATTTTTTQRPLPGGQQPARPTTPPLFHRPSFSENQQPNIDEMNIAQNIETVFATTTTSRPQTTTRPTPPPTVSPTRAPSSSGTGRELNRCVWAIISCCNPTSPQVKLSCFEQLGCPGAFWDRSPCSREVTIAALNAAQKFYDQS